MDSSSISVIIPVHNGERYVAEAIESVLAQSVQPLEIIVVDDGSTDDTATIVKSIDGLVQYVYQQNQGAAAARNRGVELARGGRLAFLDADDLWTPHKLARQTAVLDQHAGIDMVFGHVEQFISPDLSPPAARRIDCPTGSMPGHHPGTMLIDQKAFRRTGGFSSEWDVGEIIEWYARATELGLRSHMLSDVVMRRRLHTTNQGVLRPEDQRKDYVRIMKAVLDRRRAKQSATQSASPS